MEVEFILNDTKLKVNENGELWKWFEYKSGKTKWLQLKGTIHFNKKNNYKTHRTEINRTNYITSRVIYYAFYPNLFDIKNPITTIDHIDINSLNNHISNLRVATMKEQTNNRKKRSYNVNAKGYWFDIKRNKWLAQIQINKKHIHLGRFNTEEEAFNAYQNAKVERCIAPSNT